MSFTFYYANCVGDKTNVIYPHKAVITDAASLKEAVQHDYVCAQYKNNYRNNRNYIISDCLALDFDNDHSDDPQDWITVQDVRDAFPDVELGIHYSRHHLKPKEGKAPRPKFHVFMKMEPIDKYEEYKALKEFLSGIFPYADRKAKDAARFFFGTDEPEVEFHAGDDSIQEHLRKRGLDIDLSTGEIKSTEDGYSSFEEFCEETEPKGNAIPQGSRNTEMYLYAVKILKLGGNTPEVRKKFIERSSACDPPLDREELKTIWNSAKKFYESVIAKQKDYVSPEKYKEAADTEWTDPIPFGEHVLPKFPIEALPEDIRDYVTAVAETTQTPVDMAGCVALAILSVCCQGKYQIIGKPGWMEPLNTYVMVIAKPSERKSSVLGMMARPIDDYETKWNTENSSLIEMSKMQKRILEKRQRTIEDWIAKGKADPSEAQKIADEVTAFKEIRAMQLYVDDVTTEKLVTLMSQNDGSASILSAEGGIFDTLSGIYTRNVNIDVMLKGYSGDTLRVERVGRDGESISHPTLTILLMVQPSVVSNVLANKNFKGRGLTARFLYSMPDSRVGSREFESGEIDADTSSRYANCILNILEDEKCFEPEIITLSKEAYLKLKSFSEEVERMLAEKHEGLNAWLGKLVGNTLRIAGLLCRASVIRCHDFLEVPEPLEVDGTQMNNAIKIGRYLLHHAMVVFDELPEDALYSSAELILKMIVDKGFSEFDRRTAMRNCRTFKKVDDIQPVLDFLEDLGYIAQVTSAKTVNGRPPLPKYAVNPKISKEFCHAVPVMSQKGGTPKTA